MIDMETLAKVLIAATGAGAALYFFKKDYESIVSDSKPDAWAGGSPDFYSEQIFMNDAPRGVRNNNWLNIEYHAANDWVGQTGSDGRYAIFSDAKYGIRAGAKLLRKYYNSYKLKSIAEIINRWAPPFENETIPYAEHVAARLGVSQHAIISLEDMLPELIHAMAIHECGAGTLPLNAAQTISEGVALA